MNYFEDTIAAIATPMGRGAIGVVRISGEDALKVVSRVWTSRASSVDNFSTHRIYLGNILDLSTGKIIDKVLLSYMKAPKSYTGEDTIEVSCHGGPLILQSILRQILASGARLAEPGEFTKRAFLNGKMDLAQAEAVAQLIDSKSASAARQAEEQLEGRLSKEILGIRDEIKELAAFVEATIDFPEEDTEFIQNEGVEKRVTNILKEIDLLTKSYDQGKIFRDGVKMVIAGPPNAGKSSLLNRLLGQDRAIVHHVPGTTRDTIEEEVNIGGISFRLIDTAGIRQAEEEVEEIGVEKSKKELASAEVLLIVVDGNDFKEVEKRFVEELSEVKHVIIVINKEDLGIKIKEKDLKDYFKDRPIYKISAKEGNGLDELKNGIVGEVLGKGSLGESESIVVSTERHFHLLQKARQELNTARSILGESSEFISVHFRAALDALGEIVGEVTTDDLLNEIFSNFCIGK